MDSQLALLNKDIASLRSVPKCRLYRGGLLTNLIGNLHLTLLFFLGIISSIVEENAYALWTRKPRKGAYETRKNAIS